MLQHVDHGGREQRLGFAFINVVFFCFGVLDDILSAVHLVGFERDEYGKRSHGATILVSILEALDSSRDFAGSLRRILVPGAPILVAIFETLQIVVRCRSGWDRFVPRALVFVCVTQAVHASFERGKNGSKLVPFTLVVVDKLKALHASRFGSRRSSGLGEFGTVFERKLEAFQVTEECSRRATFFLPISSVEVVAARAAVFVLGVLWYRHDENIVNEMKKKYRRFPVGNVTNNRKQKKIFIGDENCFIDLSLVD